MKKYLWAIIYSIFLTGFTAHILLSTFIIKNEYAKADNSEEEYINMFTDEDALPGWKNAAIKNVDRVIGETLSEDRTQPKISLSEYIINDTSIYVADVRIASLKHFRTAFANDTFGRNVIAKTSLTAKSKNAILAINGDYYGARDEGYVIRNGVIYRAIACAGREDLVIYKDGSFKIIKESEISAKKLQESGAVHVFSFGPALVKNGEIAVSANDEVGGQTVSSNPRTSIGIVEEGHYLFIVSDGRTKESEGLTLCELAAFCKELGAKDVYNLDGGGSSTMYYDGKLINNPTTSGNIIRERSVSDIVYIGY